jgi:hypothetical protein
VATATITLTVTGDITDVRSLETPALAAMLAKLPNVAEVQCTVRIADEDHE